MIEVSNSDIINTSNRNNYYNDYKKNNNNNCETRKSNSNTNINIFSGNNINTNAALNLSIVFGINSMLADDVCTNIKVTNNVQGFKKLKPGKNTK